MCQVFLASAKDFECANISVSAEFYGCANVFVYILQRLYFCVFSYLVCANNLIGADILRLVG